MVSGEKRTGNKKNKEEPREEKDGGEEEIQINFKLRGKQAIEDYLYMKDFAMSYGKMGGAAFNFEESLALFRKEYPQKYGPKYEELKRRFNQNLKDKRKGRKKAPRREIS